MKYYRIHITEHTNHGPAHYSLDFMTIESAVKYSEKVKKEMSDRLEVSPTIVLLEG